MSAILVQILTAAASALIAGIGTHLWHTKGDSSQAPAPPDGGAPSPSVPYPAPVLFPSHPIASKALQQILDAAEEAAVAAAQKVFNAAAPALAQAPSGLPPVPPSTPSSAPSAPATSH